MDEKELEYLKIHLRSLFYNENERDLSRDFKYISDYYRYLAKCIDYQKFSINSDIELLEEFEAVHLWLQEKLLLFPDIIRKQVDEIFTDQKLCDVVSFMTNMSEEHVYEIQRNKKFRRFPKLYSFLGVKLILPNEQSELIKEDTFFAVKMALSRLSQILKYASSVNVSNYDETIHEFKDHYNPELINKNKILTLINYLRVQIGNNPENENLEKISRRLDSLEAEIQRPKVRWALVITGFFVLMGFLADLKTLEPNIYSEPFKTIESIIHVIHADGLVQESMSKNLIEHKKSENHSNSQWPEEDPPIPRKETEIKEIKNNS